MVAVHGRKQEGSSRSIILKLYMHKWPSRWPEATKTVLKIGALVISHSSASGGSVLKMNGLTETACNI